MKAGLLMYRVLVADNYPIIRMAVKNLVEQLDNFKVIAEETTPKVYKELFENQHNSALMTNHLLSFNQRMKVDKDVPMGALLCGDRLIVDKNYWKLYFL